MYVLIMEVCLVWRLMVSISLVVLLRPDGLYLTAKFVRKNLLDGSGESKSLVLVLY